MTTAGRYELKLNEGGAAYMDFVPQESSRDFSNLSVMPQGKQYGASGGTVTYKDDKTGELLLYDPYIDNFVERIAKPTYNESDLKTNWQGIKWFYQPPDPNGQYSGRVYYLDPKTNEPTISGLPDSPFEELHPSQRGGGGFRDKLADWTTENGWMIPVAMATYGASEALLGGAAAGELAGPTYAELGYVPGGFTDAGLGYAGAAEELGLAGSTSGLTDLSGAQGSALLESMGLNTSGMSAKDILVNANRARKLASLLQSGTGAGASKNLSGTQLANALAPSQAQTGGLYRMNQNPFAQTQQPTSIQTPFGNQQDFLAQLAEESKPEPTLADLLRNA
jgi:hypothetical protein